MRRGDEILLARVSAAASSSTGVWTLPGGGVDHGEHPETSLRRELHEETGLELGSRRIIGVFSRHFTGQAPHGGGLEDFHGVHLVYTAEVSNPQAEPYVVESDGTTDAAAWVPVTDVQTGAVRASDVVRFALRLASGLDASDHVI